MCKSRQIFTHTHYTFSFGFIWGWKSCSLRGEGRRGWERRVKNGVRIKHILLIYNVLVIYNYFGLGVDSRQSNDCKHFCPPPPPLGQKHTISNLIRGILGGFYMPLLFCIIRGICIYLFAVHASDYTLYSVHASDYTLYRLNSVLYTPLTIHYTDSTVYTPLTIHYVYSVHAADYTLYIQCTRLWLYTIYTVYTPLTIHYIYSVHALDYTLYRLNRRDTKDFYWKCKIQIQNNNFLLLLWNT